MVLAAARRLRRRKEFSTAVRTGRRAGRGVIVVHLATSPQVSTLARVGFIVPRGVGGAVVRNRVRRQLRHLARERIESLPVGSTLVVRARAEAADRTYAELATDLDAALTAAWSGLASSLSRPAGGG